MIKAQAAKAAAAALAEKVLLTLLLSPAQPAAARRHRLDSKSKRKCDSEGSSFSLFLSRKRRDETDG